MKIAITGHTSGIGQSLAQILEEKGYEIIGFSRANGFDVGDETKRTAIVNAIKDCDVFINNAYHIDGQAKMLEAVLADWNGTGKDVVNISSAISVLPEHYFSEFAGMKEYRESKIALNNVVRNYNGNIRLLNVLPGITKTNFDLIELNPDAMKDAMEVTVITNRIVKDLLTDGYTKKQIVLTK